MGLILAMFNGIMFIAFENNNDVEEGAEIWI